MERDSRDAAEGREEEAQGVTGSLLKGLLGMNRDVMDGLAGASTKEEEIEELVVDEGPEVTGHLTQDSLSLSHSLGYDCTRRNNLHVVDAKTLLYASGNLLHFLDCETGQLRFLRTIGGVTALQVHPVDPLFAVAERGSPPTLTIFSWPQLDIVTTIKKGTTFAFAAICFNSSGELLCLQGSEPDCCISVWNWREGSLLSSCQSESLTVYNVAFSKTDSSLITTSGDGHINFWRICSTSSGVKMDVKRGMFNNKAVTDIESFVQLGDGKVVTGCEWGNLLLWEGGCVKVEIRRRDLSTCHEGPVQQFVMAEGELITIGCDGWIRVWDLESIEQAVPIDSETEDGYFLLDPMNEINVSPDAVLRSITKSKEKMQDDENFWFLQDAGGGIWKVDLSFSLTMKKPSKVRQCHAGAVTCLTSSPVSGLVVSGGDDGRICVYDLERKVMVNSVQYGSGVSCIYWLPLDMDFSGTQVLIGFADGVLRLYYIESVVTPGASFLKVMKSLTVKMKLLQAIKPHRTCIKMMDLDKKHKILATASLDKSVYIYRAKSNEGLFQMEPIGYFQMEMNITSIMFKKNKVCPILMIAMETDELLLTNLDSLPLSTLSNLQLSINNFSLVSISLTSVLDISAGMTFINASFKRMDQDRMMIVYSSNEKTMLYDISLNEDNEFSQVESSHTLPSPPNKASISKIKYWVCDNYLLLGYQNGIFRMLDITDLSNISSWTQGLNDPTTGAMTDIMQYKDYLITSGGDGSLFSQKISQKLFKYVIENERRSEGSDDEHDWKILSGKTGFKAKEINTSGCDSVHDIEDPNYLCLEDMKLREAEEKMNKTMEDKMLKIQKDVSNLKRDFKKIQTRNETLNREYQVPKDKFQMTDFTYKMIQDEIDAKLRDVVKSRESETTESKKVLENIRRRFFDPIEYNRVVVKGLKSKQELTTFRIAKMKKNENVYEKAKDTIVIKAETPESWTPKTPRTKDGKKQKSSADEKSAISFTKESTTESSTLSKGASRQKTDVKIMNEQVAKALAKQEAKREKKLQRKKEWDELFYRKPKEGEEDPTLIEEINQAKKNMGDFKRKTSTDYENEETIKPTEKANTLNNLLKDIHQMKCAFNEKVFVMKREKAEVTCKLEDLTKKLVDIQYLLEPGKRKTVPTIPMLDIDEHIVDPFEIDPKLVETIKARLFQEAEDMMLAEKRSGAASGSRRSSKASISSRKSRKMSRQMSASSRQSSDHGTTPSRKAEKKPKHSEGLFASLGPGQGTVAEDEFDESSRISVQKSINEANMDGMKNIQAQHEQDIKIAEMEELMKTFDDKIFELVCEKDEIETRLKYAEISSVLLYEEFQIVNQDQELEANLKAEVLKQESNLDRLNVKLLDVERQLLVKQKNVDSLKDQKKNIFETVERELSDNKHSDFLWDLYNKKPTSQQKQDAYEDQCLSVNNSGCTLQQIVGIGIEDESLKSKPSDLDFETFKLIADLRDKRYDIESTLAAENRMQDNISRELANLKKNQEDQTKSLNKARQDLHSFKYAKQCKLNNLDAILIASKAEMQSLEPERLCGASDGTDLLLAFPEAILSRLHNRTEELKQERNATKSKYKEARSMFENLQLECKNLKKEIQVLDVKCGVEMHKRFGAGVTLETLEAFAVNRTLEEMRESSRAKEKQQWKIQNKREDDIKDVRYKLHEYVLHNTEILKKRTKCILAKQANKIEKQKTQELIEKNRKKLNSDEEDQKELKEMIEIFQTQGEDIMELKAVLVRYVMKGIAVDPNTGKKNLRARPTIAEITRPKSSRIKLKNTAKRQSVVMESLEKIDKPSGRGISVAQIDLKL